MMSVYWRTPMDNLNFIKDIFSQDTGGGMDCDIIVLIDGTVIVLSEEAIVLYPNLESWEDNLKMQLGTIYRPQEVLDSAA